MKKFLSSILISIILLANFLAPVSVGWGSDNKIEIKKNIVSALAEKISEAGIVVDTRVQVTNNSTTVHIKVKWNESISSRSKEKAYAILTSPDNKLIAKEFNLSSSTGDHLSNGVLQFLDLLPETTYKLGIKVAQNSTSLFEYIKNKTAYASPVGLLGSWFGADKIPVFGYLFRKDSSYGEVSNYTTPYMITTLEAGATNKITDLTLPNNRIQNRAATMPTCDWDNVTGCIGLISYSLFFEPSSYILALSGTFFDYTFNYSVTSSSYTSPFVVEGWNLVRDFVNMFFIFVLLYIAFQTILGLSGAKTKEMIINVVIIGLMINFSLFATRVIIDASNILARVFYNNIIVGEKVEGVMVEKLGDFGEKQISAALVAKINPQQIIISAGEAKKIGKMDVTNKSIGDNGVDATTFLFVTLLASVMNIIGITVFLTVGMLFVVRVAGLWLAMILVPFAFFSYTVPAMQNIGTIGWKKWWPETLKLAFLAPVFIFFIYLINKFLQTGLGVLDASSKHGLSFYVAILVPFALLMVLLMKAKDIALKMSGEIGASVVKVASSVGSAALGTAVGVASGGASLAMRKTIGYAGNKLDKSTRVNKLAGGKNIFGKFAGNKLKDIGQSIGKSSFDYRNTSLGQKAGKAAGINIGKGKKGGYVKDRKDHIKNKQQRAREIAVNEDEKLKQDVNKAEIDLQVLLNQTTKDFESIDKTLVSLRQKKNDATTEKDKQDITKLINIEVLKKANLKDGLTATGAPGGVVVIGGINAGKTIKEMENIVIPDAKNALLTESRRRTTNYANNTAWWDSEENLEAQHKIIMETKLDSGKET